jgi:hypothetical protein
LLREDAKRAGKAVEASRALGRDVRRLKICLLEVFLIMERGPLRQVSDTQSATNAGRLLQEAA